MQIRHEIMQVLVRADLRIEHAVVDDVVAVPASGPGFEHRRRVEMSDAERVQVWNERDGIAQSEAGVELKAIRGAGNAISVSVAL